MTGSSSQFPVTNSLLRASCVKSCLGSREKMMRPLAERERRTTRRERRKRDPDEWPVLSGYRPDDTLFCFCLPSNFLCPKGFLTLFFPILERKLFFQNNGRPSKLVRPKIRPIEFPFSSDIITGAVRALSLSVVGRLITSLFC